MRAMLSIPAPQMNLMTNNRAPHATGESRVPDLADAVLLVDKPEGMTSFDTVSKIQRLTGATRTGHAGTLDRFASGLLIACNGRSTKLARYLLEDDKTYTGAVKLGVSTDTDDREGAVTDERPAGAVTLDAVLACARTLTGELMQTPPRYSALKIKGRRASDRARNGELVELAPRRVTVFDFQIKDFEGSSARFFFRVHCSKGTYIRSLARDMGSMLGTGAHLESLRRTGAGLFSIEDAVTLQDLGACVRGEHVADRRFALRPADALRDFGRIIVNGDARNRILHGNVFSREGALEIEDKGGKKFIIMDETENLIAIADMDIQKWLIKYLNVFNI
jgi:tRNA pseudouridine55 synthase